MTSSPWSHRRCQSFASQIHGFDCVAKRRNAVDAAIKLCAGGD